MKWIRDAIEAAKQVRVVRNEGYTGQLYVYPHEDIDRMLREIKWQRKTYQLAYQCIEDMGQRKSRCRYCLGFCQRLYGSRRNYQYREDTGKECFFKSVILNCRKLNTL